MEQVDLTAVEEAFPSIQCKATLDISAIQRHCEEMKIPMRPMVFCENMPNDLQKDDVCCVYSIADLNGKTFIFPQWFCANLVNDREGFHISTGKPIAFHNLAEIQQYTYAVLSQQKDALNVHIDFSRGTLYLFGVSDILTVENKKPWVDKK